MYDNRRAKIVDGRAYTDGDTELYTELPKADGETAYNEIGFDENHVVETLKNIFIKVDGGSLILFHEKGGELTAAKKLF